MLATETCTKQKSENFVAAAFLVKILPWRMLQVDLVGPLQSPLYRYVLTGIDVFTTYLFAVPLTNGRSETVVQELASIFFRHSYLPKTMLSDLVLLLCVT